MELDTARRALAYILLLIFVASTTAGGFMYETWTGFVALGLTSGVAAYLLGAEETA
jgi:hypothetical protein